MVWTGWTAFVHNAYNNNNIHCIVIILTSVSPNLQGCRDCRHIFVPPYIPNGISMALKQYARCPSQPKFKTKPGLSFWQCPSLWSKRLLARYVRILQACINMTSQPSGGGRRQWRHVNAGLQDLFIANSNDGYSAGAYLAYNRRWILL